MPATSRARTEPAKNKKPSGLRRRPRLAFDAQYAVTARNLPSRRELRKWTAAALEQDARVTIRIVGQAEGKALNRNFRGKDYATNVLTFIFRDSPPLEGDLALCAPVVSREAREQRKPVSAHFAHLVVHGVLHLQGYDHEVAQDAETMEKREIGILAKLGIPDPYS
jgi:probable rRNA maturation factor